MKSILNLVIGTFLPILFFSVSHSLTAQKSTLFRTVTNKAATESLVGKELKNYGLLEVDAEDYSQLLAEAPVTWELELPAITGLSSGLRLELEQNDFLRHDFILRLASDNRVVANADLGLHYTGSVAGEPGSRVALSLLDGELTATISRADGSRLALGKIQNQVAKNPQTTYLLFPDAQLAEGQEFDCGTADSGQPYSAKELDYPADEKTDVGCVDVYFEIDYDIFFDKGGANAAAQHLAANFNEVASLYSEIGVNLHISEILVWDQISPYGGTSSSAMLTQFQSARTSFNGDLAQLVSYQASGGIAVLDGLCHPWTAARMSFSSIASNYAAVPVYSWSTMVIAHELGHLLGSQHTHACVWNGDNTAIDGCAGITEGFCGTPGIPAQGGTIMSYCHLRPQGINFNFGFGPQPTAVIANRVAAAQGCVQSVCSTPPGGNNDDDDDNNDDDDDNDDNDPPQEPISCDQQTVYVNLTLDDFGMETTWLIKTETGTVVATGGPYAKKKKGQVFKDTVCVIDGCYIFEISDSDGDGICCDYGQGSYLLQDSTGNVIGSGSQFDTLDVIDFCLPEVEDDDDEPASDCDVIDFVENTVVTYGTNQDAGTVSLLSGGEGIFLQNNAWKAIEVDYEMTPDTWVSFWFRSTMQGEVHGIGMDDNEVLSSNLTFRVYGTQGWGLGDFNNYPGDGSWRHYQIPIGQYYTLQARYLFFTADHDVGTRDGNSYFRDVVITEGQPCEPATSELPATGLMQQTDAGLLLTPNPASREITVNLPATNSEISYEVIDLTGRAVKQGTFTNGKTQLSVGDLPNGSYFFRYEGDTEKGSRRFVVAR
ncbi:T9SS type A sorting domain-containing protein [Neolewinella aurantiaca]|uniref:T9SS type A sorting domain-containing protein n=1 Tax=Neolewinella aurantiaca TaxID=2602767 RepID=A0A5C7FK04_9BACT|nr:M12 family metallo-peptidase [Neolewinella aurantiaca]TXF90984.1 T9SS type A sorting domain-containing protein [Neolewinella aurantiaca]